MAFLKLAFLAMGIALVSGAIIDSKQTKDFERYLRESVTGTYKEPLTPELKKLQNPEERSGKFQGDIVLTEEQIDSMVKDYSGARNAVRDIRLRWPNKTIYYTISSEFNAEQVKTIRGAMLEIQRNSCVKFVRRTTQPDYVNIIGNEPGCHSNLGKIGGPQKLNLQNPECVAHGTIVHELLHAAGFFHQHSTYTRDDWVSIVWDKIEPGVEYAFQKLSSDEVTNFDVEYDYGSILHYSEYTFSIDSDPPSKTIIPLKPTTADIGQRVKISPGDIRKLKQLYQCPL